MTVSSVTVIESRDENTYLALSLRLGTDMRVSSVTESESIDESKLCHWE